MCGIYGIVSLREGYSPDRAQLAPMARVTVHRGPDSEGSYAAAGVALGMRRLSIIDVSGGDQPIANEDESVWVVSNGEIYNFTEIRARLQDRGHVFRTASDTEVIVHLYEEYGLDLVEHLEGMFGFALWDTKRGRLVLGRDRLGIKPIYYHRDGDRLVFASEAKAILALPGIQAEVDPVGLEEYLALGYTPNDVSIFRGIEKLPPATVLVCEQGGVTVRQYWRPPDEVDRSLDEKQWAELILAELDRSVHAEMVSDVPLGAFLSGGIDSSAVVAMMARHSKQPVKTYSIGFDTGKAGAYYNELPYARQVADLFATDHREILVRPNVTELLPKLLWHMDEPIADSAFITTFLVSEMARREVTVILSGVGGDELFGGYRRYLGQHYMDRYRLVPSWLRREVIAPLAGFLPSDRHSPLLNLSRYARAFLESSEKSSDERYRRYVEVFSDDLLDQLLPSARHAGTDGLRKAFEAAGDGAGDGDGLNQLMQVDLATQLPNDLLFLTDRMSMATSLECRVPLLNHKLVELGARIPMDMRIRNKSLKHVLKIALKGVLPDSILYRPKRGFGAPIGAWMRDELAPLFEHVLSRDMVERRGWLRWPVIERIVSQHAARRADHSDHLLSLLNLEIWAQLYIDGRSPEDLTSELAGHTMA